MVAVGLVLLSAAPSQGAPFAFDTTSMVGAGVNTLGDTFACVIVTTTSIRCGWMPRGGVFSWCPQEYQFPPNTSTYGSGTGIFMPQQYPFDAVSEQMAFVPITFTSGGNSYMGILRLSIVNPGSDLKCVYPRDPYYFPYIGPKLHPDMGHHLASAFDNSDALYVFTVPPSTDAGAKGDLLGVKFPNHGLGVPVDLYARLQHGLVPGTKFRPDSPISAVRSSSIGRPLVGLVHDAPSRQVDAVWHDAAGNWTAITNGGQAPNPIGAGLAMVATPEIVDGAISYYDSFFAVETNTGNLYEQKLMFDGLAYRLTPFRLHNNNGAALDWSSASLAASFYLGGGGEPIATAYARRDATHGDAVASEWRTGVASWSAFFTDPNGRLNNQLFQGMQVVVKWLVSSHDLLYAVCTNGPANNLCIMDRAPGGVIQTWSIR